MSADLRERVRAWVRRHRCSCLGCGRVLWRDEKSDPATPLQYCNREVCQALCAEHQAYIDERRRAAA